MESENTESSSRIRALNDALRCTGQGGIIVLTTGIAANGAAAAAKIAAAVAAFTAFTDDNDPYSEHDCAALTVEGVPVLWKIDYYDTALELHSPDPADPKVTTRVLTIMCPDEY